MLSAVTFIPEDEAEKVLKEERKLKKKDKKKAQKVCVFNACSDEHHHNYYCSCPKLGRLRYQRAVAFHPVQ